MHRRSFPPIRVVHPHVVEHPSLGALVSGTRVPVRRLWSWHRRGVSVDSLFRRYPRLKPAQILDALSYAHDNEEKVEAELDYEREILGTELGRNIAVRLTSDRSDVATFFAWLG